MRLPVPVYVCRAPAQDMVERLHLMVVLAFVVVEEMESSASWLPPLDYMAVCVAMLLAETVRDCARARSPACVRAWPTPPLHAWGRLQRGALRCCCLTSVAGQGLSKAPSYCSLPQGLGG